MTALFHHRRAIEPPAPKVCTSHAVFWVSTPAGVPRLVCGPHLRFMLAQFLAEGGQTLDLEPGAGQACEYQAVTR